MKLLPKSDDPLVIRTDFSDHDAWEEIRAAIIEPVGPGCFLAYVEFVDDPEFADLSLKKLISRIPEPERYPHGFLIVVDEEAIQDPEHAMQIVDLSEQYEGYFRALPSTIQQIQNNLSIGNMGFEDYAHSVDDRRVFRGFRIS